MPLKVSVASSRAGVSSENPDQYIPDCHAVCIGGLPADPDKRQYQFLRDVSRNNEISQEICVIPVRANALGQIIRHIDLCADTVGACRQRRTDRTICRGSLL